MNNSWTKYWYDGDFESIFSSKDFLYYKVFEDTPWWLPEFYKVFYHRFPDSKFILFTRDSDSWFQSMINHSDAKTLGNTMMHCKIYRREKEFYINIDHNSKFNPSTTSIDNLLDLKGYEEHYQKIYEVRNREIINFFDKTKSNSLIVCDLYDKNKWKKIGDFIGIDVPHDFEIHSNKTKIMTT